MMAILMVALLPRVMQVSVKADPRFERRNLDIYSEESISYTDAILGATLDAQTVDGKMQV